MFPSREGGHFTGPHCPRSVGPHHQGHHINYLERLADHLTLEVFQGHIVPLALPQHLAFAQTIWQWALHHRVHLLAEYLPGVGNDFADFLSRMRQQVHEWELPPQVLLPYFRH